MEEIEILEKELFFGITYAIYDYALPNYADVQPWAEQLYAQMMGWEIWISHLKLGICWQYQKEIDQCLT